MTLQERTLPMAGGGLHSRYGSVSSPLSVSFDAGGCVIQRAQREAAQFVSGDGRTEELKGESRGGACGYKGRMQYEQLRGGK